MRVGTALMTGSRVCETTCNDLRISGLPKAFATCIGEIEPQAFGGAE